MLSRWRIPMRLGYFAMPLHPPGADPARTMDDDLVQLATLDRLGYEEAWIGEHFTAQWENIPRSEEHTSELQSLAYLVCRLLLEKKKTTRTLTSRDCFSL